MTPSYTNSYYNLIFGNFKLRQDFVWPLLINSLMKVFKQHYDHNFPIFLASFDNFFTIRNMVSLLNFFHLYLNLA